MNRKTGFTLAEVLITLAIIGIVAALTIPSVISNYQQQEFKTGLKKAVSVLNEAIQTNISQEGETPYDSKSNLFQYLQRHMNIVESYNCIGTNTHSPSHKYGDNSFFYTADGMRFEFHNAMFESPTLLLHESGRRITDSRGGYMISKCGSYGLANNPNNTTESPCFIIVDVNGDKKPNPGYIANTRESGVYDAKYTVPDISDKKINDIFPILITDEKAIPFGVVAQRAMYGK